MAEEFKHVVRIAGHSCDGSKCLVDALSDIKGVNMRLAFAVARLLDLDPFQRLGYLSEKEIKRIEEVLRDPVGHGIPPYLVNRQKDPETGKYLHLIGSDVDLRMKFDIDLMKKLGTWKGVRHALGLKVRGQKTRTTGRKGRTVGVQRRRK